MTDKKEENTFIKSLGQVTPIKKSNRVIKPIPKKNTLSTKKTNLTKQPNKEVQKNTSNKTYLKNLSIEKTPINKQLKKGKIPIDKKVDFHGLSLNESKEIFIKTINECFFKGQRCILFVTGKGMINKNYDDNEKKLFYGKIRNDFTNWVNIEGVKRKILNMQKADIKHGGDGAFFIYLRKNKH